MADEIVDSFIGQKFGKDGHLTVVREGPKAHSNKRYWVHCTECEKDSELFGKGEFLAFPFGLRKGQLPCGCSKVHNYTEEQWKVRIDRVCKERNCEFIRHEGDKLCKESSLLVKCLTDGHEWFTGYQDLAGGHGCRKCYASTISNRIRISEDESIRRFKATGKYHEGTVFTKLPQEYYSKSEWTYTCPICSNDEYVQNGLCSGTFKATATSLQKGTMSCRCNGQFRWTKEQREYQILKKIREDPEGHIFLGWTNGYNGKDSEFGLYCPEHGDFTSTPHRFLNHQHRCPDCAGKGYSKNLKGYLYILNADSRTSSFLGYGISNIPSKRLSTHRNNLKSKCIRISDIQIFEGDGKTVFEIEKFIKKTYPSLPQDVEGFRTEATSQKYWDSIVSYVSGKLQAYQLN